MRRGSHQPASSGSSASVVWATLGRAAESLAGLWSWTVGRLPQRDHRGWPHLPAAGLCNFPQWHDTQVILLTCLCSWVPYMFLKCALMSRLARASAECPAHHHSCRWAKHEQKSSNLMSIEVSVRSSAYFVTVSLEKPCVRLKILSDGSGEDTDEFFWTGAAQPVGWGGLGASWALPSCTGECSGTLFCSSCAASSVSSGVCCT